ncbi:hypothetical protein [Spirillospora albida]|uniref:hypothetical protein n=1 Tax=Spirillospora albida TaxID=58123 RepID=UPI0006925BF7|nr:hypothetical protein [Spirillospora albida]
MNGIVEPAKENLGLPLGGLGLAILGLIVQWISKPSIFEAPDWGALPGNFPPGVLVIALFGGMAAVCARWWWSSAFASAIGVWIFIGGIGTGEMANAFRKGNAGSVFGLLVMSVGLVIAIVAGIFVMYRRRRSSPRS